ncbi:MAG: hypothetical protein JWM91_5253 [Rhodospirillales bacterium]|nr:hypothetical protein [Rhodospirillales bacterium]
MPALTPAPSLRLSSAPSGAGLFFYRPASVYQLPCSYERLQRNVQTKPALSDISAPCVAFWHQYRNRAFEGCGCPCKALSLFWRAFRRQILHFDRLHAASLSTDPFDFLYVPATIDPGELAEIVRDFPEIPAGGSFDVATLESGPAFQRLVAEIRSDAFRTPFEKKFEMDLAPYPLHITVRGHVRGKDGAIHTDSKEKILTGLLYLNLDWNEAGGRLRLLRDGKNLESYALEIPPVAGNMVVFRRSDRSWHGHLPSKSRRLALQFNWVSGDAYVKRELARHRFSGWMKRLSGAGAGA